MKAFADAQTAEFFFDKSRTIVRKRENYGIQNFLVFTQCFKRYLFCKNQKLSDEELKLLQVPPQTFLKRWKFYTK